MNGIDRRWERIAKGQPRALRYRENLHIDAGQLRWGGDERVTPRADDHWTRIAVVGRAWAATLLDYADQR